jgi:hypothetical protein
VVKTKNDLLRAIHKNSIKRAGQFARKLTQERKDKELILAGMEFEKELADCCRLALE